jgi:hypothetical protein
LNWSIIFLSVVRFNENIPNGLQLDSCAQAGGLRELNGLSAVPRTRLEINTVTSSYAINVGN